MPDIALARFWTERKATETINIEQDMNNPMQTEKEQYKQPELDVVELSLEGSNMVDGSGNLPGYEGGED